MTSTTTRSVSRYFQNTWILVLVAFVVFDANGEDFAPSTNTVSGTIRVFDIDGRELEDRSDVVVFLDGMSRSTADRTISAPTQISHKGRQFSPNVLPLVQGSSVDFLNDDDIFHNVFSLSKPRVFDLGIYEEGASKLVTFPEPGVVRIHCNIHPKMTSTILVLNNNLFAKTGADGSFQIDGIPDGQVTLRVWSEFSEPQSKIVSLDGGVTLDASFQVHETKRFVQHRDKFGKRYREKY